MSKGLEALKDIKRDYTQFMTMYDKEQLDIIEKELKAFAILKLLFKTSGIDLEDCALSVDFTASLSRENYNLLKEVLL